MVRPVGAVDGDSVDDTLGLLHVRDHLGENHLAPARSPLRGAAAKDHETAELEHARDHLAGIAQARQRVRPHVAVVPGDAEDLFVDWGDKETYSLKLGRGECAA